MKLIMIGLAGSGKGTQSTMLSKYYNIPTISVGALLREKIKSGDEIGKKINSVISSGKMVDDAIIYDVLRGRLGQDDVKNGFILDGFPRNIEQAIELDKWLKATNDSISAVIVLDVAEDVVIKRITGRYECVNCGKIYNKYFENLKPKVDGVCDNCQATEFKVRADDSDLESIKKRLDIFKEMSNKIISYYDKQNLIYNINGDQTPEKVYQDILSSLKNINK